jgi:hypothetical protein
MSTYSLITKGERWQRPKSEDKRNAILSAPSQAFAERGLGAATSAISSVAGVAEGTLFAYFNTKDELVNALYREIKVGTGGCHDVWFSPKEEYPLQTTTHLGWLCELGPCESRPAHGISATAGIERLTKESRAAGSAPFVEIETMGRDAIEQRVVRGDVPLEFIGKMLGALAETTMEFMAAHPKVAGKYRSSGFEMFWAGIARR